MLWPVQYKDVMLRTARLKARRGGAGRLRTLQLVNGRGEVRAAEELIE